MRAGPLPTHRAAEVRDLLAAEPDTNQYLLSTLQSWGLTARDGAAWYGADDDHGQLCAVAWSGRPTPDPGARRPAGLVVPWGDPGGCRAIGAHLALLRPPAMLVGPRPASDALWSGLGDRRARLWYDQRLYVCTAVTHGPRLTLRPARPAELPLVIELSAAMMAEDLGADPRRDDAAGFERRVRARVLAGRCLLGLSGRSVIFKLDVGSHHADGVQVGGTFVPPRHRGRGVATAGMRAACDHLHQRYRRVTLHVNEANRPAVAAYERCGFTRAAPFRLASL